MSHSGDLVLVSGLFSILVCTVQGRSRLIGSSQPIVSAVGDDVILPCHVEPRLSVENMTVDWWKPDDPLDPSDQCCSGKIREEYKAHGTLRWVNAISKIPEVRKRRLRAFTLHYSPASDPMSDYKYVHSYENNRVEEDLQMESYASRTSLFTDDLKHGNVSLKIKKVKLSDGGLYRCDVPQLASASFIRLVVGAVVRTDCAPQSDPRCISCVNGTFMRKPGGLIKCFLCSSCDRGPGVLAQQSCTATTDTVCDVVSGYFCKTLTDETGCSLAQKHSPCGPGHRIKRPGTSRTDTVCERCPPGYFSLEGVNCTVWTTCSENTVKVKGGSWSSDVVCGAASRQRYGLIPVLIFPLTLVLLVIRDGLF